MTSTFYCPVCAGTMRPPDVLGTAHWCPHCGEKVVPDPVATASPVRRPQADAVHDQNKPRAIPDSGLFFAVMATLFCCWPLGIVAIINAAKVNSAYTAGDYDQAQEYADKAQNWTMWTVVGGLISIFIYFLAMAAGGNM